MATSLITAHSHVINKIAAGSARGIKAYVSNIRKKSTGPICTDIIEGT